ncbi:hypothetical protein MNV49_000929 [Pseudohyphozyma bogoriensis]|nr:hypothetical protein MNV49_000929 [Pseudohyphozyma bogoriensis]
MLPRAPSLRRYVRTDALQRLMLDINAAQNADQKAPAEPAPPVSRSDAALRGQTLRGDVQLPMELQEAVNSIIEAADKPAIRLSALDLYAQLRATTAILPPPSSYKDKQALMRNYDATTSVAFLAGLMPSIYAATLQALTTTRDRLKVVSDWEPDRVIDYGSGTGSAAWVVEKVWGATKRDGQQREYVGLDASETMVELSSSILGALTTRVGEPQYDGAAKEVARISAKAYQLPIPASSSSLAKLQLGPKTSLPATGKKTLALSAFTLGEMGTKEKRRELVRAMWESGAEVIVIVDRGTPGGSRMVIEAREQLLKYGKQSLELDEEWEGEKLWERGAFVVAPELEWPRIVNSPVKSSGHVVFDMCAASGDIERHIIPKSQGRQAYYDARKASRGDSFPHPPKNGSTLVNLPQEKAVDKFGKGRSKLQSKKALRSSPRYDPEGDEKREKKRGRKEGVKGVNLDEIMRKHFEE